jgi:hypothetical protein
MPLVALITNQPTQNQSLSQRRKPGNKRFDVPYNAAAVEYKRKKSLIHLHFF